MTGEFQKLVDIWRSLLASSIAPIPHYEKALRAPKKPTIHRRVLTVNLLQRLPAKLHTHCEEPQRERKTHRPYRNARGQSGSDHCAKNAAHDEVGQQSWIESAVAQMHRAADQRQAES